MSPRRPRQVRRAPRAPSGYAAWLLVVIAALLVAAVIGVACVTCAPLAPSPPGRQQGARTSPSPAAPAPSTAAPALPLPSPARTHAPAPASGIAASVHVALGVPTDAEPADDYLMDKGAYVVSYNPKRNVPNWVSWKLDRSFLGKLGRHDKFLQDRTLPPGFVRVSSADYAHSGFDRGHMCPSADRNGNPNDNVATFLMTNMQPQLHELNAGPWKDLEEHGRSLARTGKVLFIVAGGVFGPAPRTIGRAAVAVPDANYKVLAVLEPGQGAADVNPSTPVLAALMPNKAGVALRPWRDYVVSVDQLEQATSYDFLSNVAVAVQQVLESRVASP